MALNWDNNHALAIKILNVIVFIFFFGSNLYSSLGGPSTGYYSQKETYITPAPETFWIWTVINFLFLGFVVFQFFESGTKASIDVIGWRFAAIGVLQSIWIHLSAGHHYILAFIFSVIVASVVSHVYWDLVASSLRTKTELFLVHLPFSLLHAYLVFLLVLSAFTAFGVDKADHKAGPITQALVIVALLLLASTGIGYTLHSDQRDVAGAIVIAIELVGVFTRQTEPESIHWVAFAAFIATILAIIKAVYSSFRGGRIRLTDSEHAPLIA
ncbi:hypothetical protein PtA15_17A232 [Puccinia triticina]|uniref:Uncharacterized protein n=1 Tax=Puccinia triticina TaxID=208348 RepID=A0ABY7D9Q6_9BASI|nr:uncharacterized protein PtA15_17A232 [Puccinia triticina]WAQ92750.1 hypothetical protein PtA15_17A232 [Puccinia triticina]